MQQDLDGSLAHVDPNLCIRILHVDEDIVVVDKPCNLRSVPGHATTAAGDDDNSNTDTYLQQQTQKKRPHPDSASRDDDDGDHPSATDGIKNTSSNPSSHPDTKRNGNDVRLTAQQSWEAAIRSFATISNINADHGSGKEATAFSNKDTTDTDDVGEIKDPTVLQCLQQLASSDRSIASIPRKWKFFQKYWMRNQKRLLRQQERSSNNAGEDSIIKEEEKPDSATTRANNNHHADDNGDETNPSLAATVFTVLQHRQKSFHHLPTPTRDEDSAYGQLVLVLRSRQSPETTTAEVTGPSPPLYIVHRLDCETSGVMVFARNQAAASILCKAWRREGEGGAQQQQQRDIQQNGVAVSKIYWAKVRHWPPYHDNHQTQGIIDLPLAPNSEERLKWKIVDVQDPAGKPSITHWRILQPKEQHHQEEEEEDIPEEDEPVLLELTPLTGRTHQLRIHCAHVGSGIIGDSLYGQDQLEVLGQDGKRLLLHAHQLSFPHPTKNEMGCFQSYPQPHNW